MSCDSIMSFNLYQVSEWRAIWSNEQYSTTEFGFSPQQQRPLDVLHLEKYEVDVHLSRHLIQSLRGT